MITRPVGICRYLHRLDQDTCGGNRRHRGQKPPVAELGLGLWFHDLNLPCWRYIGCSPESRHLRYVVDIAWFSGSNMLPLRPGPTTRSYHRCRVSYSLYRDANLSFAPDVSACSTGLEFYTELLSYISFKTAFFTEFMRHM